MSFLSSFFSPRPDYPAYIKHYLESQKVFNKNALLDELSFVIFDTETTSLDVREAKLLSVGALRCDFNKLHVNSALDCYIDWGEALKLANVDIHGITRTQSISGISPPTFVERFLPYIGNSVLVAHNLDYDVAIINNLLDTYYPKLKLNNACLDTARLAIRLEQSRMDQTSVNPQNYTLDALLKRYNIEPLERHTALGDAYSTALLFIKLIAKLQRRGLSTFKDLI